MNALIEEVAVEQVLANISDAPPPPYPATLGDNLSDFASHERPTAAMLVAEIAIAARQGRIPAWNSGTANRDFEPIEQPDGSWLTCCPAHDDHNPSFIASDGVDGGGQPRLLVHCRSGCDQSTLIETLERLGLWNCTPETIDELERELGAAASAPKTQAPKRKWTAIIPAPADAPSAPREHPQLGPAATRYAYRSADDGLVFYVYRFEPNDTWKANFGNARKGKVERPDHKTFRPLSYCKSDDGSCDWQWLAPQSDIPLYRSERLAANPTAKVIVCEGEKAARAAQRLFPDRVAITWCGGAKAARKAPWKALAKRDVLVWPDCDETGAGAAQAIINELRLVGCASISAIDAEALAAVDPQDPDGAKRSPPPKWDAADALLEWIDLNHLAAEIDEASRSLPSRVRVEVSPDNIGETVDKAEEVLRNSPLPVFKRGGFIVRVGRYEEKTADGETRIVLFAQSLASAGLGEALESVISFEQYDARPKRLKPVHAPDLLLKTLLERGNLSGLMPLTAVTDIPLVRRNGTLLDTPGYDDATGIYFLPSRLLLDIPEDPTLDDAKDSVETLKHLIRDFPFESDVDMAAAISAFVSAVNRPTLGATPMHVFSAPTPGSGKSLLASIVTIVATGSLPSFITQGPNDEELEKRLATQMLEGRQVINLDNCDRPLKGAALCNLLTAERVSLRILGQSKAPEITSNSSVLVNGSNVRLADDLVRRAVFSRIDPRMEHPEERAIGWDAEDEARRNRGKYVSACMTIMRAYGAAGSPRQTTPLGGFENWSRRVRDAIIWAGLPDPCANADKMRDADPDLERYLDVAVQWEKHFGNLWKKLANVIKEASDQASSNAELKLALMNVAEAGRDVSANRLAAFLGRYADRPLKGFKFVNRKARAGTKLWRLEKVP